MALELVALHAVQEQVPLGRAVFFDRNMFVNRQSVMLRRRLQDGDLVIDDKIVLPDRHSPVPKAPALVQHGPFVQGGDVTQAAAGGTSPLGLVKGEMGHRPSLHGFPAMGTENRPGVSIGFLRTRPVAFMGGRHHGSAGGAGPLPRLGIQNADQCVDVGHGAHGGPGISVRRLPADADRRRKPADRLHLGFADRFRRDHSQGFQVQPLTLPEERIHDQAGFSGPGGAGDHHQPILGDVEGHVLQIVLPGAPDFDLTCHADSPFKE